jgi:hypothetical protein
MLFLEHLAELKLGGSYRTMVLSRCAMINEVRWSASFSIAFYGGKNTLNQSIKPNREYQYPVI